MSQLNDIYIYNDTTGQREKAQLVDTIIAIQSDTSNVFMGATIDEDALPGYVPSATKDDMNKFLAGDGKWKFIDISTDTAYITKENADLYYMPQSYFSILAEPSDINISGSNTIVSGGINDTIYSPDYITIEGGDNQPSTIFSSQTRNITAINAVTADILSSPITMYITDNNGHDGNTITITGNENYAIPIPLPSNIAVSGGSSGSGGVASSCTGTADNAKRLTNAVTIRIVDASGKVAGDDAQFDGSNSELTLYMPDIIGSSSEGPLTPPQVYIQDSDNHTGTTVELSYVAPTGIDLPETITAYLKGKASMASQFDHSVNIYIAGKNGNSDPVTFNGSGSSTVLKLPTMIEASITGNAATATNAIHDSLGNDIHQTYAPLTSPTLTGVPCAPTAPIGTANDQIANTAFVGIAIANAMGGDTGIDDNKVLTLSELSSAVNYDPSFATNLTDDYQPLNNALTSIASISSVTSADNVLYTTGINKYSSTKITELGRQIISATKESDIRSILNVNDATNSVDQADRLSSPVSIVIQDTKGTTGDISWFDGSSDVTIGLPSGIYLNFDSSQTVPYATKLEQSPTIYITDKSKVQQNGVPFDGDKDITITLPATIQADLKGNASTASALATSRNFKVQDKNQNTKGSVPFNGMSDVTLTLPDTIAANYFAGPAQSAYSLTTLQAVTITDHNKKHSGNIISIGNSTSQTLTLPATINADITGNASTASALKNEISAIVSLNSTIAGSIGASSNVTLGVSGTLPENRGGTGKTTLSNVTVGAATQLSTTRKIDGVEFKGDGDVTHYYTCTTSNTAATKVVVIPGWIKENGARVSFYLVTANTATTVKLGIKHKSTDSSYIAEYSMIGADGNEIKGAALKAGLYNFTYYNEKFYLGRIPGLDSVGQAEQAIKDSAGRVISNTYVTTTTAVTSLSYSGDVLTYKNAADTALGTVTISSANDKVAQNSASTGSYPILLSNNSVSGTNSTKFSTKFTVNIGEGKLIVPIVKADTLILPTTASTIPGAIWIEA